MSHSRDTDYLSISARIRAMENRLLTGERMERMIEARDFGEAAKVLTECGYGELSQPSLRALEALLTQARQEAFRDIAGAVPDVRVVEVFILKYDYHNAKVLLKARHVGADGRRLLLPGGRYDPAMLLEQVDREEPAGVSETFRAAWKAAWAELSASGDPQRCDVILDRECYQEMLALARETGSGFLEGYVRLLIDVANLRTAVRVARQGKGGDFLRQVLLPGGGVSESSLISARGEELAGLFASGPLAEAAVLGAKLAAGEESGALTEFERLCDNALTTYLASGRRVAFGVQAVIGYLYAKEAELTALRTILSGRLAGLDGDTIRARLRKAYL